MQQEFPERKLERGLLGAALVRALLRALFKFEGLMSVMHLGMCVCVYVCAVSVMYVNHGMHVMYVMYSMYVLLPVVCVLFKRLCIYTVCTQICVPS